MGNIRCDNIRYLHRSFHYVFKFSPHNLQRMYHRFQQFVFFTIVWKQFRSLRNTYSYVFNISSDQDILTWFYLSRSSPSSRHNLQVCCLSTTLAYSLNFLYLLLTFEFFALVRRSIRLHTTTVQNTYIKHDVPTHSQTWLPGRMGRFSSTFHGVHSVVR